MKRHLLLFLILVISFCTSCFASEYTYEDKLQREAKEYIEQCKPVFNACLDKLANLDIQDTPCKLYFSDDSDSLIIGCSPVSYMWMYGKTEVMRNKYDLIGFGGTLDSDILNWLKHLKKRNYKKIVLWFGYNDVFEAIDFNKKHSDRYMNDGYFAQLKDIISEAKEHLRDDSSELDFILLKSAKAEIDLPTCIIDDYNRESKRVNDFIRELKSRKDLNIKTVSIEDFDTVPVNAEWFVHFTNPVIHTEVFNRIERKGE